MPSVVPHKKLHTTRVGWASRPPRGGQDGHATRAQGIPRHHPSGASIRITAIGRCGAALRGLSRGAGLLALAATGVLLAGCQGSGRIDVTPLNYRDIDPPAARFSTVDLQRAGWWTDEQGQVWIALERDAPLFPLPQHFVFQLSLVLDELPAGKAKNYLVSQRELRGVARLGPAQSRLVSIAGIVALYRGPGDHLRGSLRLDVSRQAQQLLGGWAPPVRYLMLGTFDAVPDDGRGRKIAAATEAYGWERKPPASAPTTRPAAAPAAAQPGMQQSE
jgi:hypothetical protein